jgi:signal transduction histidine kinase
MGESSETDRLIHNIRNPLNAISINAELGKLCLERGDSEDKLRQALEIIIEQCGSCAEQLEVLQSHLKTRCED